MNKNNDDLLQPSLSSEVGREASIYSARTGYIAGFFGGPLAAAAVALLNSHRLNRLGTDWALGLVALLLTVALFWWEVRGGGARWLVMHFGAGSPRVLTQVAGLGMFAVVYGFHRKYYRNMQLLGLQSPSGWIPGIIAIIVGIAGSAAAIEAISS
jgi:cell division protein FtsW (lipid II flippase)